MRLCMLALLLALGLTLSTLTVTAARRPPAPAASRSFAQHSEQIGGVPLPASLSLLTFDGSYLWRSSPEFNDSVAHEHMQLLAALGGLVNRAGPTLFLNATQADAEWFAWLRSPGRWLAGAQVEPFDGDIVALTARLAQEHPDVIRGVVLYDRQVPASSNVASSMAGIEGWLPLLSDGVLYPLLCLAPGGPQLPVAASLVGMFDGSVTGSRKNDAYAWFVNQYMNVSSPDPRLNPLVHGYLMDCWWSLQNSSSSAAPVDRMSVAILNSDYVISQRGILWDLDVWATDIPNDDPTAAGPGIDVLTIQSILGNAYNLSKGRAMIHIVGFVPWAFKYLTAEHGGVASEWQASFLFSSYNAFVDADACCDINTMANAALYAHYPLPLPLPSAAAAGAGAGAGLKQNPAPSLEDLVAAGYVNESTGRVQPFFFLSLYVGDFDSAAWSFNALPSMWEDPMRGKIPLGWAVNPTNSLRFAPIFDLMYSSLTPNDRIVSGDSGAGYVNPTQLFPPRSPSGLPSGAEVWQEHCSGWYERFDLTFTGFIINGAAGRMSNASESMYTIFSPAGGVNQFNNAPAGFPAGTHTHLQAGVPFFEETDLGDDPVAAGAIISAAAATSAPTGSPSFAVFRSVLKSPSWHVQVVETAQASATNVRVVDPLALSLLAKIALTQAERTEHSLGGSDSHDTAEA